MPRATGWLLLLFALAVVSTASLSAQTVQNRFATVNVVRLRYLEAGTGSPIILLHGFGETSHMWLPVIPKLAVNHTFFFQAEDGIRDLYVTGVQTCALPI